MKRLWMTVLGILVFGCAKVENLGPVYHYPYTVLEYLDTDKFTDFSLSAGINDGDERIGMSLKIPKERNRFELTNYIPGRETIVSKGQCKDRAELREKFIRLRDKLKWEDAKVEIYKDHYYKLCFKKDTLYMAKGWI